MKWFEGVIIWNNKKRETDTEHCYCNPRRGSPEYAQVAQIVAGAKASQVGMKKRSRRSESPKQREPTRGEKVDAALEKIIAEKKARDEAMKVEDSKMEDASAKRKMTLEKLRAFEKQIREANVVKKREMAYAKLKEWAKTLNVKKAETPGKETRESMMKFYEARLKAMNPSGEKLRDMLSQISGKPASYYKSYTRFKNVADLRNELVRLVREKEGL